MTKVKNFNTLYNNQKNLHLHKRQTHQGVYNVDENNKLTRDDQIDVQQERSLFLDDCDYKSAIDITKDGKIEIKKHFNQQQPNYGDVSDMPKSMNDLPEFADKKLAKTRQDIDMAIQFEATKYNKNMTARLKRDKAAADKAAAAVKKAVGEKNE